MLINSHFLPLFNLPCLTAQNNVSNTKDSLIVPPSLLRFYPKYSVILDSTPPCALLSTLTLLAISQNYFLIWVKFKIAKSPGHKMKISSKIEQEWKIAMIIQLKWHTWKKNTKHYSASAKQQEKRKRYNGTMLIWAPLGHEIQVTCRRWSF